MRQTTLTEAETRKERYCSNCDAITTHITIDTTGAGDWDIDTCTECSDTPTADRCLSISETRVGVEGEFEDLHEHIQCSGTRDVQLRNGKSVFHACGEHAEYCLSEQPDRWTHDRDLR